MEESDEESSEGESLLFLSATVMRDQHLPYVYEQKEKSKKEE